MFWFWMFCQKTVSQPFIADKYIYTSPRFFKEWMTFLTHSISKHLWRKTTSKWCFHWKRVGLDAIGNSALEISTSPSDHKRSQSGNRNRTPRSISNQYAKLGCKPSLVETKERIKTDQITRSRLPNGFQLILTPHRSFLMLAFSCIYNV